MEGSLKDKRIGVLLGGLSDERDISLKTGSAVLKALSEKGYTALAIDAGRDLASVLLRKKIEVAFLALHGRYGEDGCVQGMLEVMGIPYTGSGVAASAMAMDKITAKKVFAYHGVSTPQAYTVKGSATGPAGVKMPVVVKPASQGSAIGVHIVRKRKDLEGAMREAMAHGAEILVEQYIEGRELTVSIFDGEVLPMIEIRPKEGFYDFTAKYTKGMTEFIVPARLKKTLERRVRASALGAYRALGCAGAARVDVMVDGKDVPYVLEVNTIPGMTEHSLFPRSAACAGMDYPAVVERMLKGAGLNKS
jgi:D-alanine-D-alanine ligase